MTGKPSRLSRFLSLKDVALALGVSIKSLRRWIDAGDLRVHRLGRQLRVSEEDLAAFLSQRRR
jgi:excisionase family DNA binding protein